jgi:hypothetical protein
LRSVTLDPVHVDGIADLARRIRHDVDESDARESAEAVWADFLDPLYDDGEVVLEPLGEQRRFRAPADEVGLQSDPFDTVHGLDSGTINPRTFENGLVLDVAQAAMSATPSDLDLHRGRTIVKSVHSNDATVAAGGDWEAFDSGYSRKRVVQVERLARDEEAVVHGIALSLAEGHHALTNAGIVEDLLLLDGPLYPKHLVQWAERRTGIRDVMTDEPLVGEVLETYLELVERFVGRDVPVAGFVKNPRGKALLRALGSRAPTPWASDTAFFRRVLDGAGERELAWTNWFRSRLGSDGTFRDGLGIERALPEADYEVAFFVVFDPRTDLTFKVELPAAFAVEEAVREAVRTHVLREVAARGGPPLAVAKADSLARIGAAEKESLVEKVSEALDSPAARTYDDDRWGAF